MKNKKNLCIIVSFVLILSLILTNNHNSSSNSKRILASHTISSAKKERTSKQYLFGAYLVTVLGAVKTYNLANQGYKSIQNYFIPNVYRSQQNISEISVKLDENESFDKKMDLHASLVRNGVIQSQSIHGQNRYNKKLQVIKQLEEKLLSAENKLTSAHVETENYKKLSDHLTIKTGTVEKELSDSHGKINHLNSESLKYLSQSKDLLEKNEKLKKELEEINSKTKIVQEEGSFNSIKNSLNSFVKHPITSQLLTQNNVLGGAAIAATLYGTYKVYKYFKNKKNSSDKEKIEEEMKEIDDDSAYDIRISHNQIKSGDINIDLGNLTENQALKRIQVRQAR